MSERPRVLIVAARFYEDIAVEMEKGVAAELEKAGVEYDRLDVPGVFELPAAIRFASRSERGKGYDGYVALGCVIRGETDHYDHICREASRSLMDLTVLDGLALGFGVLTCPTYELALERARIDRKNKGAEVAHACLRMMDLKRTLRPTDR